MVQNKNSENTKVIRDQIKNQAGADPIKELIKKYNIDESIWYVDSFKIKDGKWNTAAKKRDQELEWTTESQTEEKGGKNSYTKTKENQQIMRGFSKHFPEFMMAENKTYSIEITFKRLPLEHNILESFERLMEKFPTYPYSDKKPRFKPGSGHALELSTFDAHFGKLAWELETGYRNYDLKIVADDYKYVCDEILEQALPYKPEKIFMPLGQDIYHMDNMQGKTTRGEHTLDVDGRITKVNDVIFEVVLRTIYKAREIAPVKIIWSPGNHDHFASYMLCFSLKQHFKDDPHVEVDLSLPEKGKRIHKAELWGTLLVGWTHRIVGKHNTWHNELSQAFPELWAKSIFREWHHGDQHKKQDVKTYPVFTSGGVLCRQITALSPVDKWHTENLFTDAVPGGEGYIWHKTKGVRANLMGWIGQYTKYRNSLIKKQ